MAYHKKPRNEDDDLEDLLRKADQVLGETPPEEAEEDAPPAPWEDLRFYANYSNHYGQDVRNYQNNYGRPNEPCLLRYDGQGGILPFLHIRMERYIVILLVVTAVGKLDTRAKLLILRRPLLLLSLTFETQACQH